LKEWGFDASEFKATEFDVVDLIHPDDKITQATTSKSPTELSKEGLPNTPSIRDSNAKRSLQGHKFTTNRG